MTPNIRLTVECENQNTAILTLHHTALSEHPPVTICLVQGMMPVLQWGGVGCVTELEAFTDALGLTVKILEYVLNEAVVQNCTLDTMIRRIERIVRENQGEKKPLVSNCGSC